MERSNIVLLERTDGARDLDERPANGVRGMGLIHRSLAGWKLGDDVTSSLFDELAKALARHELRRRLLRRFGAGAVGLFVATRFTDQLTAAAKGPIDRH